MPHEGKRSFNLGKNKLVKLLRNGLRILFLLIFLHWILWFTTYAKCTNYYEAINDEKIDQHDKKTEKYNSKGLLSGEHKERDIGEIEKNVLEQIEKKSKKLAIGDLPRKWEEKLPDLKKLYEEFKALEKKGNPTTEEKEQLTKKRKDYQDKFKEAKQATIDNIKDQLKDNELNITELDDDRSCWQQITHDPLKFFIVSPLNKFSKALGLHSYSYPLLLLEIIFKLVIIEIISLFIFYSETIKVWENTEKMRNPYLSVEEKEQLNEETSPLVKYMFFNGFMVALFTFFLFFHPAFFDRTAPLFQAGGSWTAWYIWIFLLFITLFLSNISNEFLRHGRLLNKQEFKKYVAKSWATNLIFTLIIMSLIRVTGMNSVGNYSISALGGLIKFIINTLRVKFFGHREYQPGGDEKTTYPQEQQHN